MGTPRRRPSNRPLCHRLRLVGRDQKPQRRSSKAGSDLDTELKCQHLQMSRPRERIPNRTEGVVGVRLKSFFRRLLTALDRAQRKKGCEKDENSVGEKTKPSSD